MQEGFLVRTSTENAYGCRYGDYTIETSHIEPFTEVEGLTRGRRLDPLTPIIWINPGPQLGKINRRVKLMAETCEIIDRYLGISTKGHTHRKHNPIPIQSLDFVIQNDTALDVSAMVFLSNHCNKQDFGDLQSDKINSKTRLTAKKYSGDANRSMIMTALETVDLHKPVIRKADDTDALVMCQDESQTSGLFLERGGREGV